MNPIETKVQEKLQLVPEVVTEIAAALETEKICGDEKLDVIIPAIGNVIQVAKTADEKYAISFIDNESHARKNEAGDSLSLKEWIQDYVFEPSLPAGAEGFISYADSLNCSAEQLQKISEGKLIVGKPDEVPAADGSIPSSQLIDKTNRGEVAVEDIASGKVKVDLSK